MWTWPSMKCVWLMRGIAEHAKAAAHLQVPVALPKFCQALAAEGAHRLGQIPAVDAQAVLVLTLLEQAKSSGSLH